MKHLLYIFLLLFFLSCSKDVDYIGRHNFGDNIGNGDFTDDGNGDGDHTEIPADDRPMADDEKEKADSTVRAKGPGIEIRYGDPGVVYSVTMEESIASLADVTTGHVIRMQFVDNVMLLDERIMASSFSMIQYDSISGKVWYHGYTVKRDSIEENLPVYFIYEPID